MFPITFEREAFSSELFRVSRGAAQPLPSIAVVKNEWSYTLNLPFGFMVC
jgi:hypothetical protein